MSDFISSIVHIALVGGGRLCKELLEKTTFDYTQEEVYAPIIAVADPDPQAPGMLLAEEQGLLTFTDYHQLYDPRYSIHLIILLTPDEDIFQDILNSRPSRIRIMSFSVFEVFWKAIDIEERKLRKRNKEIETIINGIQDFIMVITPDMDIIEVNDAYLKKMGYAREKVIGSKCHEIYQHMVYPCDDVNFDCPLNEVIRNKRPCRQIRTRVDPSGEPLHIEVSVYPIWEKDGKISKFIHISRDITEQKLEEEEITRRLEHMVEERTRQLKETHDKLLHQDKMSSLGKLSASVVHEINNPIAGILNLTMLIKRMVNEKPDKQDQNDKQFLHYLNLMETETRRISRIVNNLLSFSRDSKMEFTEVDIHRLIEKTLFLNANLLKLNGVKVEKHFYPELPKIIGSEDQLQQVFMNIISNATETIETLGSGVLSIKTNYLSKTKRVAVSFQDTGIAIPRENVSKIFEPFFTTKKVGKGVGLGLSVAYGIIRDHNGSIYVKPKEGKGNTFTIKLPLKQPSVNLAQNGGFHG
ncbi:MAG: PAS domain-containing protein [Desulfobacterales bacterium]|nr:MAG: PAS domain-containing protein [Desulfobacterales bacterium]